MRAPERENNGLDVAIIPTVQILLHFAFCIFNAIIPNLPKVPVAARFLHFFPPQENMRVVVTSCNKVAYIHIYVKN